MQKSAARVKMTAWQEQRAEHNARQKRKGFCTLETCVTISVHTCVSDCATTPATTMRTTRSVSFRAVFCVENVFVVRRAYENS